MTFRASAPAKIILFGEHAVVYGHQCVATALDNLRIHAAIVMLLYSCSQFHINSALL